MLLASKMVNEGFGVAGNDIGIGADILTRAALSDAFTDACGRYCDNDANRFGTLHSEGWMRARPRPWSVRWTPPCTRRTWAGSKRDTIEAGVPGHLVRN